MAGAFPAHENPSLTIQAPPLSTLLYEVHSPTAHPASIRRASKVADRPRRTSAPAKRTTLRKPPAKIVSRKRPRWRSRSQNPGVQRLCGPYRPPRGRSGTRCSRLCPIDRCSYASRALLFRCRIPSCIAPAESARPTRPAVRLAGDQLRHRDLGRHSRPLANPSRVVEMLREGSPVRSSWSDDLSGDVLV